MSVGFNPKYEQPLNRALKVQELAISGADFQLYSFTNGGPIIIPINEPVFKVVNAFCKIDASDSMYEFNYASMSIVDSKGTLSGYNQSNQPVSDRKVIQLAGFPNSTVAANDLVVIKYIVQEHL